MRNNGKRAFLIVIITAVVLAFSAWWGYTLISLVMSGFRPGHPEIVAEAPTEDSYDLEETEDRSDDSLPEAKTDEEYTYKDQNTRTYSGPRISQAGQYIYNTDGKVITDFHDGERFYLDMTVNIDASEAVLVYDEVCYYIDADLNMTEIATGVRDAAICYEGGYFYYVLEDKDYNTELYIYDVANQKANLIESDAAKYICISPNGRTVAFFDYARIPKLRVDGLDVERWEIKADGHSDPITVSNDGETVFYEVFAFDTDMNPFHCLDHGKDRIISKDLKLEYYFDRECKQIMFMDAWGVKYYKAGDKEPTVLTKDKKDLDFAHCRGRKMPVSVFSETYILDTDCFSDVLMVNSHDKCYALVSRVPEMICITGDDEKTGNFFYSTINDEGPAVIGMHRETNERSIRKFSFDGKEIKESIVFSGDSMKFHGDYGCSNDLKKIWIVYDHDVYYVPEEGDLVLVASEGTSSLYKMEWNELTQKCYFVKSDKYLVCVGTEQDSEEEVSSNCKRLSYSPNDGEVILFAGLDGEEYLVIGDEILPK